jgi:hypothetical protein
MAFSVFPDVGKIVVIIPANNGTCVITGNYSGQKANHIVAMISNGVLPLSFRVIK